MFCCCAQSKTAQREGLLGDAGDSSGATMADMYDLIKNGDLAGVQRAIENDPALLEETVTTSQSTPLLWAVDNECRKENIARYLIDRGANVNAQDKDGCTPLMFACQENQPGTAELLVNKGAKLDLQDKEGGTALMFACRNDQPGIAQLLINKGAKLDLQDKEGWTALKFACRYDQPGTAQLLINKGAKLDLQDNVGFTALILACNGPNKDDPYLSAEGMLQCVKLLYAGGASLDIKSKKIDKDAVTVKKGSTALDFARAWGRKGAVAFLEFVSTSELVYVLRTELDIPRSVVVTFYDNSIRTLDACRALDDEDLQELGVEKKFTRKAFLGRFNPEALKKRVSLPARVAKRLSGVFLNGTKSTDCFLTHNWGPDSQGRDNHARVARVNTALKGAGKKTWFDEDRLTGNVVQQITSGLQNTKKVIVFITKSYMEKLEIEDRADFCRDEYLLAFRTFQPRDIIPVLMEPEMRDPNTWTGPLAFHAGQLLYIDFSNDSKFDEAFAKLFSRLTE